MINHGLFFDNSCFVVKNRIAVCDSHFVMALFMYRRIGVVFVFEPATSWVAARERQSNY